MFKNKNILVTGSTGDIGSKISYELYLKNANIFVTSRNEKELKNFEKKYNCKSNYIVADLKNNKDIKELALKLPNLNGMVLNAGTLDYCPVKYINYEKMLDIFQINFFSNVLLIKELLTQKKIEKNCSIVIIGSISSLIGTPATSIYAASKAALSSFSKVLASELLSRKIRVNTVSPGIINTKMTKEINQFNELKESYPFGLGDVEDVLNQVLFLLSDKSKWTTGSNFILDGGYFLK